MTPLQYIALRAPQWAGDPRLVSTPSLLDIAEGMTSTTLFGTRREEAVALRVLHMLAMDAQGGGNPGTGTDSGMGYAGRITSESEGQLSRSYSSSSSGRFEDLSSTSYGAELAQLIKGLSFGPRTRGML